LKGKGTEIEVKIAQRKGIKDGQSTTKRKKKRPKRSDLKMGFRGETARGGTYRSHLESPNFKEVLKASGTRKK